MDVVLRLGSVARRDRTRSRGSISDFLATGRWQITRPDAAVRSWGWLSYEEIYWQDAGGRIWVVSITPREGGGGPALGAPRLLFEDGIFAAAGSLVLDDSIAREQFLVARPAAPAPRARLIVVSAWSADL